jgi:DNA helicase-2/ATP-dependent DNA helicase PcrA
MLELDKIRQDILSSENNLLIMGGPGSGKTTIALVKAKQIIECNHLKPKQQILFLSFARSTISRVEQQAGGIISKTTANQLEVNTYHSFTWNIIKSHGYLLNTKQLKLLPPHEAAAKMAGISAGNNENEIEKLFNEEGIVHFDYFAKACVQLLSSSNSLLKLIANKYPVIILDEFQDTNSYEWQLVSLLGKHCRLIALADPEQRIYDFRGADPARLKDYIDAFDPECYDFQSENNRSTHTDIVKFGNDLLAGKNIGKQYNNVILLPYKPRFKGLQHLEIKLTTLKVRSRFLKEKRKDWSIAILVPSNTLMLEVSEYLSRKQTFNNGQYLPSIFHEVSIDSAGPALAGTFIAHLLEYGSNKSCISENIITLLCNHIKGRRGNKPPPQIDMKLATALENYLITKKLNGKKRIGLLEECKQLETNCNNLDFTGDIAADWLKARNLLEASSAPYLNQVAIDAKYLRLLRKGTQLFSSLSEIWANNGTYTSASNAVANALAQEHFATSTSTWTGVNVMTIHKSKGKEFDEVILYEGIFNGRFVSSTDRINQSRLNLRVGITRAREQVTILTPNDNPCSLLF